MEPKTGRTQRTRNRDSGELSLCATNQGEFTQETKNQGEFMNTATNQGELSRGGVPDLLQSNLKILFIGINPGLRSGETGHHFAGRSNRFWRFLAEAGFTPTKYEAAKDFLLLDLGYGITNIAPRVTAAAAELAPAELRAGAERLLAVLQEYRPTVAAYLGKVVYRYAARRPQFTWGRQAEPLVPGMIDFVTPNPSGLNRMPIPEQLELYRELRGLVK
jgi:TDG/mug DNA glycosylase family protein